jgi:NADPH-dependent 2,4-dienoyl-CoA reductase/sulfur reductase-like enzyme
VNYGRIDGSFLSDGHIVIVGASLAGLHAAETLRTEGFMGQLTLIGDEPYEPYDRPPLSKQVLTGWVEAENTALPQLPNLGADWRLGVPAARLDLSRRKVDLADGQEVDFDRLLIATGTRARPWPDPQEAALDGVVQLRGRDDASALQRRLVGQPRHVLVIGAGFLGSEVASVCRELGLQVTVAERGPSPLSGALGGFIGNLAAETQREAGVDLRCGASVSSLQGDAQGRLSAAQLDDGSTLDVDLAVVALGALPNTEWLQGSGLGAGPRGVACDAGCRAFDMYGIVTDDIFAAGDVARSPHALFGYQFLALEHWSNSVEQARVAAHNMLSVDSDRRPHLSVPSFWSNQFGLNIKSVGVPPLGEQIAIVQGSLEERRFVAAYGSQGRVVAAVAFNQAKWLEFYLAQIEAAAPFPPRLETVDKPALAGPYPADFPDPRLLSHSPLIALTGYSPTERSWKFVPGRP